MLEGILLPSNMAAKLRFAYILLNVLQLRSDVLYTLPHHLFNIFLEV